MFSKLVSLVLFGISTVLAVLACALPDWTYANSGEDSKNSGIWETCTSKGCEPIGNNVGQVFAKIFSVLMIVGLLISMGVGFAPAFSTRSSRMKTKRNNVPFYTGVLSTLFGILTLVISSTVDGENQDSSFIKGAGFYLEIIATALAGIASILVFNPITNLPG